MGMGFRAMAAATLPVCVVLEVHTGAAGSVTGKKACQIRLLFVIDITVPKFWVCDSGQEYDEDGKARIIRGRMV